MSALDVAQLTFFSKHAPFNRMDRKHLLWMLARMQVAYYAEEEVITSPEQGEETRFFVIQQGLVQGSRISDAPQDAMLELHSGECPGRSFISASGGDIGVSRSKRCVLL